MISSPRSATATVELSAEGEKLGTQNVALEARQATTFVCTRPSTPPARWKLPVWSAAQSQVRSASSRQLTLRQPKVLYLSNDPDGTEKHLLDTLTAAQFVIDRSQDAVPQSPRLPDGGV